MEGTGSYGAALSRYLRRHQVTVIEVTRPDRAARRHGKTDTIDAVAAARAVLSRRAVTVAKTGDGPIEMLRLFRLARASAVKARTQAINQLKAVIITADPQLRETLSGLTSAALIRHCANLPQAAPTDAATAARHTLRRLALRIQASPPRSASCSNRSPPCSTPTRPSCCNATASDPTAPPRCSSLPATIPTG